MKVDRSNREKDARGKFVKESEGSISRPYTEKELQLIREFEKKQNGN